MTEPNHEHLEKASTTRDVIDFGGHFYTDLVPSRPEKWAQFDELVGPAFSDPEAYAAVQSDAGITGTVLAAPLYVQRGVDIDDVTEANDVLLDVATDYDHFVGALASIPIDHLGEGAAEEFERCLEAGFDGGIVETINDEGVELIDREFEPIFEIAEQADVPLFVHPRANSSLDPDSDVLTDEYRGNSIFGREVTLMDSLCKVIHEGILDSYPDLDLVYDHTAGNIASNIGRLEYQLDPDRWPGENEKLKPWTEFRAQLEDRIFVKLSGYYGDHRPLEATLETFPSSQILFGTDFPMEVRTAAELEDLVKPVDALTSRTDGRKILAENARELTSL